MQKLCKVLVALLVAVALTGIPSFASAPALASELPGLQFAIEPGTGDFVQFQTGPIYAAGEKTVVSYDSLRLAQPANPSCPEFKDVAGVKGYVMSDNSGKPYSFRVSGGYLKFGTFTTPECYEGSDEIQIWFVGYDQDGNECYDSDFGENYSFSVICPIYSCSK